MNSIKHAVSKQLFLPKTIPPERRWKIAEFQDVVKVIKKQKPVSYMKLSEQYYGGRHLVTALPGHGIGPEMLRHILHIVKSISAPIDFEIIEIGQETFLEDLEYVIMSVKRNRACLKTGNVKVTKMTRFHPLADVEIRRQLDLHVAMTRCMSMPTVRSKYRCLDLVAFRQNTEGEYAMLEHENVKGVVECLKIVTRPKTQLFAEWVYRFCEDHGRKKVTVIHKANIMKLSDGLFLNTMLDVAKRFPKIQVEDMIVDNASLQIVSNPFQFDVIATSNLYGNVVTALLCGLTGGAGLTSGRNYGDQYAVFETATRNVAEKLLGKDVANPLATVQALADLLSHLGHEPMSKVLREAVIRTCYYNVVTPDAGGKYSTTDVVHHVLQEYFEILNENPDALQGNIKLFKPNFKTEKAKCKFVSKVI